MKSIYCAKPNHTVGSEDGIFVRLPYNFADEAAALGAGIQDTASGFSNVVPLVDAPEHFKNIRRLSESVRIAGRLSEIKGLSENHRLMVNAIAPYSLLTTVSTAKLQGWLIRCPDEVLSVLDFLSDELAWYLSALFHAGVKVVSLSDPHAQKELLGDMRFRKFCAGSQMALLKRLAGSVEKGVLHLCPYSFSDLEAYELIERKEMRPVSGSYEEALLISANQASEICIIGGQCPHTKYAKHVYYLSIQEGHKYV